VDKEKTVEEKREDRGRKTEGQKGKLKGKRGHQEASYTAEHGEPKLRGLVPRAAGKIKEGG
jgi:hypothetical protein